MKTLLLAFLAIITISLADDIKTLDGTEYKNVTISRVEPDGIVVMTDAGIEKIAFTQLSADLQKKYGYNPAKAQAFANQVTAAQQQHATQIAADRRTVNDAIIAASHPADKPTDQKPTQQADSNALAQPAKAVGGIAVGEDVAIHGTILRRSDSGLLVECEDSGKTGAKQAKGKIWLTGIDGAEGAKVSGRGTSCGPCHYTLFAGFVPQLADHYEWASGTVK